MVLVTKLPSTNQVLSWPWQLPIYGLIGWAVEYRQVFEFWKKVIGRLCWLCRCLAWRVEGGGSGLLVRRSAGGGIGPSRSWVAQRNVDFWLEQFFLDFGDL